MSQEFKDRLSNPNRASTDIIEHKPAATKAAPNRRPRSSEAAVIAREANRREETAGRVTTEDGDGTVIHTRPGTMTLYKPTERNGWIPRTVSASAIGMLFKQGWQEFCPDCQGHHTDRKGNITTDPNACTARPGVAVRICPVDGKRIYDNMSLSAAIAEADDYEDDPNVIHDDPYAASSPEQRTKLKLDLHLWVRHPEWAQANGVPPLPSAFREMVDQVPAGKGT